MDKNKIKNKFKVVINKNLKTIKNMKNISSNLKNNNFINNSKNLKIQKIKITNSTSRIKNKNYLDCLNKIPNAITINNSKIKIFFSEILIKKFEKLEDILFDNNTNYLLPKFKKKKMVNKKFKLFNKIKYKNKKYKLIKSKINNFKEINIIKNHLNFEKYYNNYSRIYSKIIKNLENKIWKLFITKTYKPDKEYIEYYNLIDENYNFFINKININKNKTKNIIKLNKFDFDYKEVKLSKKKLFENIYFNFLENYKLNNYKIKINSEINFNYNFRSNFKRLVKCYNNVEKIRINIFQLYFENIKYKSDANNDIIDDTFLLTYKLINNKNFFFTKYDHIKVLKDSQIIIDINEIKIRLKNFQYDNLVSFLSTSYFIKNLEIYEIKKIDSNFKIKFDIYTNKYYNNFFSIEEYNSLLDFFLLKYRWLRPIYMKNDRYNIKLTKCKNKKNFSFTKLCLNNQLSISKKRSENEFEKSESWRRKVNKNGFLDPNIYGKFYDKILDKKKIYVNYIKNNCIDKINALIKSNNFQFKEHLDKNGNNLFHFCAIYDKIKIAELILNKKNLLNTKNRQGNTAFHLSIIHNNLDFANMLILKYNVDQNIKNIEEKSGWDLLKIN